MTKAICTEFKRGFKAIRRAGICGLVGAGLQLVCVWLPAQELGLMECVDVMMAEHEALIKQSRDAREASVSAGSDDDWIRFDAYKRPLDESGTTVFSFASGHHLGAFKQGKYHFRHQSGSRTPAMLSPRLSDSKADDYFSIPVPASPTKAYGLQPFDGALQHQNSAGSASIYSTSDDSSEAAASPCGTLWVKKVTDPAKELASLNVGESQGRGRKTSALICNRFVVDIEGGLESFNVCCAIDRVNRIPDFIALAEYEASVSAPASARNIPDSEDSLQEPVSVVVEPDSQLINESVVRFLRQLEATDQYQRKRYRVGETMPLKYRNPRGSYDFTARVVGIGTSTVVFRFDAIETAGIDDPEIRQLNQVLPGLAFRRIYFEKEREAMFFRFHQLAQVKFFRENGLDILPAQFWQSDAGSSARVVMIAQPFLKKEHLLETYFPRLVGKQADETITVFGKEMTVVEFLEEVLNQIVTSAANIHGINGQYKEAYGDSGSRKIIEGFCDSKVPNYACERDPETDRLRLYYFDLFPAHLQVFNQRPSESNGHFQFEIFDAFYHDPASTDELVRTGMVEGYKNKYESISDPSTMLTKLAASVLDIIFPGCHKARQEMNNLSGSQEMQLFQRIVEIINQKALHNGFKGQVSVPQAFNYWWGRVQKNMILRLGLDFLDHTDFMGDTSFPRNNQAMPASDDEQAVMEWAASLYRKELKPLVQRAKRGKLRAGEIVPVFRTLAQQYMNSTRYQEQGREAVVLARNIALKVPVSRGIAAENIPEHSESTDGLPAIPPLNAASEVRAPVLPVTGLCSSEGQIGKAFYTLRSRCVPQMALTESSRQRHHKGWMALWISRQAANGRAGTLHKLPDTSTKELIPGKALRFALPLRLTTDNAAQQHDSPRTKAPVILLHSSYSAPASIQRHSGYYPPFGRRPSPKTRK